MCACVEMMEGTGEFGREGIGKTHREDYILSDPTM